MSVDVADRSGISKGSLLRWDGSTWELFQIFFVNLFFNIVTLGLYHFWGKTRVRRYLWNRMHWKREPLDYVGSGKELFLGFLKVLLMYAPCVAGIFLLHDRFDLSPLQQLLLNLCFVLPMVILWPYGIYSARRYLLSRTRWRGIRMAQSGNGFHYATLRILHGLVVLLTLGFYYPFYRNRVFEYVINNSWFGNEQFQYDGSGWDLFPRFVLHLVLGPLTLGCSWFWYFAAEKRYVAEHTRLQGVRFDMDHSGLEYAGLMVSNGLIYVLTLGLASPWVLIRKLRFLCRHLETSGSIRYGNIAQTRKSIPTTGEGWIELFNVHVPLFGLIKV